MSKWWTLVAVCLATFMLLLDVTIVNVALPSIERDLGASFSDLQWVVDAYALTLAAFLLTAGSVADLVGRRRVFVIGVAVFTGASLLCGLAHTPLLLNLARGVQGTGAAMMFACALALLASAYQGRDRGTAFGIWGATTGAAVAVGPLAGGLLTEGIGWEAIFFVNIPIGLGVIALTQRTVEESRAPSQGRVDVPGVATFSTALFLLVFALIRSNEEGWGSALIVGMLGGAAALLGVFIAVERRSDHPMLELGLFRKPAFVGASLAAFVLSASMFAMFLYLTLYIQNQLSYSALESGLRFLPTTLLSFFVAPVAGKLAERLGIRWFVGVGLVFVGTGLLLMSGLDGRRRLDRPAAGPVLHRCRHRHGQPAAGDGGRRSGRAVEGRHGLRDQLDVPSGRHRDRHRRMGCDLPVRRQRSRGGVHAGHRRADATRPGGIVRGLHLVRAVPAARPGRGRGGPRGIHRRARPDPDLCGGSRRRGCHPVLRAHPPEGFRRARRAARRGGHGVGGHSGLTVQPLFEHRLEVDGFQTRVLELEGDGPGLVLFHGFGDSADTWRPLLDVLGRRNQRAIAVDLPGFGAASRLGPGAILPQLDAFAGALVERVASDAGGQVIAGGNSLGGVVSLRLAERADLPLAGVVPIAPAGLDMPRWFELIERDPVVRSVLALPVPIPRRALALAVGETFRRLAFARPRSADARIVAAMASHHPDRAAVSRLLATGRRLLPELTDPFDLTAVECPVLLIWGTRDRMVSHSGAKVLSAALPGTDVVLLDDCGHCPQLEETDRVAELLLAFAGDTSVAA